MTTRAVLALEDIAASLRVMAARETSESRDAKAVRLLLELGSDNISAIAKACGVHRTTLYRSATFRNALDRMRAVEVFQQRQPRAVSPDEL